MVVHLLLIIMASVVSLALFAICTKQNQVKNAFPPDAKVARHEYTRLVITGLIYALACMGLVIFLVWRGSAGLFDGYQIYGYIAVILAGLLSLRNNHQHLKRAQSPTWDPSGISHASEIFPSNVRSDWKKLLRPDQPAPFFISYKSEDSQLVRQVSEMLMSCGVPVWIDQYRISLFDRDDFRAHYLSGLHDADTFIVFLHDLYYSGSIYCEEELANIETVCGQRAAKVLTIITSPLAKRSDAGQRLRQIEEARLESSDLHEIIRFIDSHTGADASAHIKPRSAVVSGLFTASHGDTIISLDCTGWNETNRYVEDLRSAPEDFIGPEFRSALSGNKTVLLWSLGPDPENVNRTGSEFQANVLDDKKFAQHMKDFADRYMRRNPQIDCIGTHALFKNGLGHLALTYWNVNCWVRMYSLMLPHPRDRESTWEGHFHFSYYGGFREFCTATPIMERLVNSFAWN